MFWIWSFSFREKNYYQRVFYKFICSKGLFYQSKNLRTFYYTKKTNKFMNNFFETRSGVISSIKNSSLRFCTLEYRKRITIENKNLLVLYVIDNKITLRSMHRTIEHYKCHNFRILILTANLIF